MAGLETINGKPHGLPNDGDINSKGTFKIIQRYEDQGDGTVKDTKSGLVWSKDFNAAGKKIKTPLLRNICWQLTADNPIRRTEPSAQLQYAAKFMCHFVLIGEYTYRTFVDYCIKRIVIKRQRVCWALYKMRCVPLGTTTIAPIRLDRDRSINQNVSEPELWPKHSNSKPAWLNMVTNRLQRGVPSLFLTNLPCLNPPPAKKISKLLALCALALPRLLPNSIAVLFKTVEPPSARSFIKVNRLPKQPTIPASIFCNC